MNKYEDWSNDQIKQAIAKRLGYRIEHHEHTARLMAPDGFWIEEECWLEGDKPGFVVLSEKAVFTDLGEGHDTEAEAWLDLFDTVDWSRDPQYLIRMTKCTWEGIALQNGYQHATVTTTQGNTGEATEIFLNRALFIAWLNAQEAPRD